MINLVFALFVKQYMLCIYICIGFCIANLLNHWWLDFMTMFQVDTNSRMVWGWVEGGKSFGKDRPQRCSASSGSNFRSPNTLLKPSIGTIVSVMILKGQQNVLQKRLLMFASWGAYMHVCNFSYYYYLKATIIPLLIIIQWHHHKSNIIISYYDVSVEISCV